MRRPGHFSIFFPFLTLIIDVIPISIKAMVSVIYCKTAYIFEAKDKIKSNYKIYNATVNASCVHPLPPRQ